MEEKTTNNGNSIESFYIDTVILITGATGFLGQALLEKLLRSCPRVSTIYVLIRNKRGRTMEERVKQLKNFSVFDRLRIENPRALDKICPIEGDISLPNLGLTLKDRNMIVNKVNIVFHSAVTIRFDEPLKVAVNMNTKGTIRMLNLCKKMQNLISFVYVSTAFSNANRYDVEEAIYNTKLKPSTVINMCANLDDKMLKKLEESIMEGHPNTYTYTKNLAEQIVWTKAAKLPAAIVRPSIIGAAVKEPFPGWLYGYSEISALLTEASTGSLRYYEADQNVAVDIIAVDHVVDTIVCVPWHRSIQTNNSIPIYNCTNNSEPMRNDKLVRVLMKQARDHPTDYLVWYPDVMMGTNSCMYRSVTITQQYFLAFIRDIIFRLRGRTPINMESARRLDRAVKSLTYFSTREWNFHRNNMRDLAEKVKLLEDSSNFNINVGDRDLKTYISIYFIGIRKFLLKENIETVNVRRRLLILYCLYRFIQMSVSVALPAIIIRSIFTILRVDNYIELLLLLLSVPIVP